MCVFKASEKSNASGSLKIAFRSPRTTFVLISSSGNSSHDFPSPPPSASPPLSIYMSQLILSSGVLYCLLHFSVFHPLFLSIILLHSRTFHFRLFPQFLISLLPPLLSSPPKLVRTHISYSLSSSPQSCNMLPYAFLSHCSFSYLLSPLSLSPL